MRIVYDDAKQGVMVEAVEKYMSNAFRVKEVVEYEWGTDRVQMHRLKSALNLFLADYDMSIGNTVTHAHGIGNNCMYPVYYQPKGATEIQHCGNINLNSGLYGEGYVSMEDYNGKRIGSAWEIHKYGGAVRR